jgi:hypothetical protein
LLHALHDNLGRYEQSFGVIDVHENQPALPMTFGGPTAQA